MPKVELNLEDDELKELLLGDWDKAMQSIMAKILDEILKSEATEQIKAKAYERSDAVRIEIGQLQKRLIILR
ncbi:hypothetical protein ACSFSO_08640, partial [Limosilactobacillus fermentum]